MEGVQVTHGVSTPHIPPKIPQTLNLGEDDGVVFSTEGPAVHPVGARRAGHDVDAAPRRRVVEIKHSKRDGA
jgi:hypothetical protein